MNHAMNLHPTATRAEEEEEEMKRSPRVMASIFLAASLVVFPNASFKEI
jgi:hypothetical protein